MSRHAGPPADDLPLDIDEFAAAADQEVEEEPAQQTVAQCVVAAVICAAVVMAFVFAGSQWWRPGGVIDDTMRTDCGSLTTCRTSTMS